MNLQQLGIECCLLAMGPLQVLSQRDPDVLSVSDDLPSLEEAIKVRGGKGQLHVPEGLWPSRVEVQLHV